jgi:phenylacetic acid degradation operon negative regulatory protein
VVNSGSERRWSRGADVQPQDLVITMLGIYVHPHDRTVWSGGLVSLLQDFDFSHGAARIALSRLAKRGLLDRIRSGRLAFYALTARSRHLLDEGDRRIFTLGQGPRSAESWTILWQSIPEDRRPERGRLARRLRFLGFGTLQDGTWVSPHQREQEVVQVIEDLGVGQYAAVVLGKPAASLDFRSFVERVWPMDSLSERYRQYVEEFGPFTATDAPELTDRDAFIVRTRLTHAFRSFPSEDPELPDDFMSEPRFRAEAIAIFTDLYHRLMPASDRYFLAVTTPPAIPGDDGAPRGGVVTPS